MGRGFVPVLELIITMVILIFAFGILFPRFVYRTRWDEALLLITGRDVILTLDRMGRLYSYTANITSFRNFWDQLFPRRERVYWLDIEGRPKDVIWIACNCTSSQMIDLLGWVAGLKVNGRNVTIRFCYSWLRLINMCLKEDETPDGALIWGYHSDLAVSATRDKITKLLEKGAGVVEMIDFSQSELAESADLQREIFGLEWHGQLPSLNWVNLSKPDNASHVIYGPYKYFYHIPIPLRTTPTTGTIDTCTYEREGNFTFHQTTYQFWICGPTSVYFEGWGLVYEGEMFELAGYDFLLSYVDATQIGVSFEPGYRFEPFVGTAVRPVNQEFGRILAKGDVTYPDGEPVPAAILNRTVTGRVGWLANVYADGQMGDDERLLLISLLLWASEKRVAKPPPRMHITSYIDVVNRDVYEVWGLYLGVGYPF